MEFASGIQENLLAVLAFDAEHAKRARALVPERYYAKYYREIYKVASEYYQKYNRPIAEHLYDECMRLGDDNPKDADIYERLYGSISELSENLNVDYVVGVAARFVEYQVLKSAIAKSIEALKPGTEQAVLDTRKIFKDALTTSFETFDRGLDLRDRNRFMRFTQLQAQANFDTGIPELEGLGPIRGGLHVLGAPYGRGKSWWLLHLAKHAMRQGARVLYLSLEMPEPEICERISMTFFGYGKTDDPHKFFRIIQDEHGKVLELEPDELHAGNLYDKDTQRQLYKDTLLFEKRQRFILKCVPSGTLTMDYLEAFLDNLEADDGFVPDIIIVDYLAIGKINKPEAKRQELGAMAVRFRGICQMRNAAGVTVAQLNRGSLSEETSTGGSVAEDFSITQHADRFLTYNQTEAEEALGVGRIWVDKGRQAKSKFSVLLTHDLGRGQFVVSSARMSRDYFDLVDSTLENAEDGNGPQSDRRVSRQKTKRR